MNSIYFFVVFVISSLLSNDDFQALSFPFCMYNVIPPTNAPVLRNELINGLSPTNLAYRAPAKPQQTKLTGAAYFPTANSMGISINAM